MSKDIEIFQEHGGVLQSTFGKATITFFAQQIELKEDEVKIYPSNVSVTVSKEEKELFEQYYKPVTSRQAYGKAKSAIHELADLNCHPAEKKELLKTLKSDLNQLIKSLG
ncbi:hypothetical protein [Teredinibacter waterburyi]|uniref:hypothetical protein n=1 Tax=Teredinibacter waterburyi TaxID=1500538 RepID=UPI00165FA4AF|nr:hypothetical protein [Teredinibacter waterburyi]